MRLEYACGQPRCPSCGELKTLRRTGSDTWKCVACETTFDVEYSKGFWMLEERNNHDD